MPLIVRFPGAQLRMHPDDHAPPHVHLITAEDDVMIDLRSGEVLRGKSTGDLVRQAKRYVEENRDDLLSQWAQLTRKRKT